MECKRISRGIAQLFYQQYEHLGNVGQGCWHFGLYSGRALVAAESFGNVGYSRSRCGLCRRISETSQEVKVVQLCRGGCIIGHGHCLGSRAVSISLRALQKTIGPTVIIAYADERYSEIGTIYQATNAIYLGLTDPKGQANYVINGRLYSAWSVRKRYGTRAIQKLQGIEPGIRKVPLKPKHKYVYVQAPANLKRRIVKEVMPLAKPYPRRKERGVHSMDINSMVRQRA